ncbi:hypothetical protein Mapa_004572 [Marchantia paleacea]|nr:hypothetical protein Mapa_004572 [Marchantia paleacea]
MQAESETKLRHGSIKLTRFGFPHASHLQSGLLWQDPPPCAKIWNTIYSIVR